MVREFSMVKSGRLAIGSMRSFRTFKTSQMNVATVSPDLS